MFRIDTLMCLVVISFALTGLILTALEIKREFREIEKADQSQHNKKIIPIRLYISGNGTSRDDE